MVATARFGLGAAPGEIAAAAGDPRGWVLRQLKPQPVPALLAGLPDGTRQTLAFQQVRQAILQGRRDAVPAQSQARARDNPDPQERQAALRQRREALAAVPGMEDNLPRVAYQNDVAARLRVQVATTTPVYERLVAFWANHFTVSVQRPPVLGLAGPFEREAIRPHVLGRFEDMLLAVARHQAMLLYLDNAISIGPGSRIGRTRERGLNENLAREILELHTLGVDGGYTQDDVRALAMILTGWSIARQGEPNAGGFRFRPFAHEPGAKTLLGRRYADAGEGEGVQALKDLAHHPATARHVAARLARHFISDAPPKPSVERLAGVFQRTGGDLHALARAVVEDDQAWAAPLSKVRQPGELVVAALRATGLPAKVDGRPILGALRRLGQAPFAAPSPAGWPDTADDWVAPEAMVRRVEWASALAQRLPGDHAPMTLFEQTIGPAASAETRQAVERAPSARDGLALVFAAPEFQRR
ncbi:MAG: DUF1800 domain-containing protein [Alphaproteobacteria bacterium]|nr:DUF1800 domain-containing protein [Alphaproteobacteria bacterium]